MVWDKDNLTGKAKAAHTSKTKQGIHSLLPISRQGFSHPQDSRAPSHITVTWEDKHHPVTPNLPPFLLLSPALHAKHNVIWHGISPSVSWGQLSRLCSPRNTLCTPSLLTSGAGREAAKTLTLCKHCSALTKTSRCYQHCFQDKPKI